MKRIVIALSVLAVAGCSPTYYSYPLYQPQSRPAPQTWPLRVAIAYPEEGRVAPNRDVDIEPIITSLCHETPTYISPRLEISRGLFEELQATGAFQIVHWAPPSLDDYDLIVRMTLLDGGRRMKSERCPALLGPWTWELAVTDQTGREWERQTLTFRGIKLLSSSPVAHFRKSEGAFMREAVKPIMSSAKQLVDGAPNMETKRTETYLSRRAPELTSMRQNLASPAQSANLTQTYLTRLAAMQATRETEETATISHQTLNDKAWADIQAQAGKELKTLGEEVRQIIANSFNILFSGLSTASALRGAPPSDILRAMESAKIDTIQRIEEPGGLQSLLGQLPQNLLPRKAEQLLADVAKADEIVQSVRTHLQMPASHASPPAPASTPVAFGCGKDTDCKGNRICVNHACVEP